MKQSTKPLEDVYVLVRDNLDKLVPYLPNVDKIEVKKHAPKNDETVEVINHWYGKVEMPGMLKNFYHLKFLAGKMLACGTTQKKL